VGRGFGGGKAQQTDTSHLSAARGEEAGKNLKEDRKREERGKETGIKVHIQCTKSQGQNDGGRNANIEKASYWGQ